MYGRYCGERAEQDGNGGSLLETNVLMSLMNIFTRPERKRKRCVDYMLSAIFYDKLNTMQRIVCALAPFGRRRRRAILSKLSVVEELLKFT